MAGKKFTLAVVFLVGVLCAAGFGQDNVTVQTTGCGGCGNFAPGNLPQFGESLPWQQGVSPSNPAGFPLPGVSAPSGSDDTDSVLPEVRDAAGGNGGNDTSSDFIHPSTTRAVLNNIGAGYAKYGPALGPAFYAFNAYGAIMSVLCPHSFCGMVAGFDLPAFGANDLVMGLRNELPFFKETAGKGRGNTILSLIERDLAEGNYSKFYDEAGNMRTGFPLMKEYMNDLKPGERIHFTLDSLERSENGELTVFDATSKYYMRITPQELRYMRSEWGGRFGEHNVSFYSWGAKVPKPW